MPPVFGPWSPSNARLWSCAEASAIAVSPSQSAKNDASSPVEKFLHHDFGAGRAERAAEHHVDRGFAPRRCLRHHHALAGRQAVGLDDDRRALRAHVGLGRRRGGEALVGGGRDAVRLAQVLGEALGAFELRRRLARAERLDAGGGEIVDDAGAERRLRADHHEVDVRARGRTRSPPRGRRDRAPPASHSCAMPALPGAQ